MAQSGYYPLTPCRIIDTRNTNGPLGGPSMSAGETRVIPVLSSQCAVPSSAVSYSMNFTVVPKGALGYLTTWATGMPQPNVSTLNAPTGIVTANSAIVPSGNNGDISVYTSNATDVIIDINGYFGPAISLNAYQIFNPIVGTTLKFSNGYGDITTIDIQNPPAGSNIANGCVILHFTKDNNRAYHFTHETWFGLCKASNGAWYSTKSIMVLSDLSDLTLDVISGFPTYLFIPDVAVSGKTISMSKPYNGYYYSGGLVWSSISSIGTLSTVPWITESSVGSCPVTSLTNGTELCMLSHQKENCPGSNCDEETWYFAPNVGPVMIVPIMQGISVVDSNLTTKRIQ